MRHISVIATCITAAVLAASPGYAQTPSAKAYRLQLKQFTQIPKGKAALVQGAANPAGDRFFVQDLSIIQPVVVTLVTRDKADDVKLRLAKYQFDEADKTASTKGTGTATIKLRTQGEMKIVVSGADAKPYQLVVWAGPEVKPEPPAVVLGKRDVAGGGSRVSPLTVVILVAGGVLLILGGVMRSRRQKTERRTPTALMLALAGALLLGGVTRAQTPSELTMDRLWNDLLDIGSLVNENVRNLQELQSAFQHLNPGDSRYDPNYNPEGQPEVPISCETAECQQCYEQSIRRLTHVRVTFEQLRAIYQSTKDMADKAMAFGDSASGVHALSGLSWQYSKRGIEEEMAKLGRSYDEKYKGLLGTLRSALDQMATCEREHFDNPDWYNRFGFIYYTFMEDRYRR